MWREVYNVYSAALSRLACVTSIQRGSRGEVKFEHEVQGESKVQLLGYDHAWRSPHASHSTLTSPSFPFVRKPHRLKPEWSLSQANWKWPNCEQTAVELTTRNLYSWVAKFVIKVSVSSLHSDLTHARIWLGKWVYSKPTWSDSSCFSHLIWNLLHVYIQIIHQVIALMKVRRLGMHEFQNLKQQQHRKIQFVGSILKTNIQVTFGYEYQWV